MKATHAFIDDTSKYAPWHVINADSRTDLKFESFMLLSDTIDKALATGKVCAPAYEESFEMGTNLIKKVDFFMTPTKNEEICIIERSKL